MGNEGTCGWEKKVQSASAAVGRQIGKAYKIKSRILLRQPRSGKERTSENEKKRVSVQSRREPGSGTF